MWKSFNAIVYCYIQISKDHHLILAYNSTVYRVYVLQATTRLVLKTSWIFDNTVLGHIHPSMNYYSLYYNQVV